MLFGRFPMVSMSHLPEEEAGDGNREQLGGAERRVGAQLHLPKLLNRTFGSLDAFKNHFKTT